MSISPAGIHRIFSRIEAVDFSGNSGYEGVGDTNDAMWKHNLLFHRDIARLGTGAAAGLLAGVDHPHPQVRDLAIKFLGLHRSVEATNKLIEILDTAEDVPGHGALLKCEAAIALGKIGGANARDALMRAADKSGQASDVVNRCKVGVELMDRDFADPDDPISAFAALDEQAFRTLRVAAPAPDFALRDTNGAVHRLSDFRGRSVAVVWIFAEWCGVCHNEFHELEQMKDAYQRAGVGVLTVQVADLPRARVMAAGHELWWPHLADPAGAVGAAYGVDPFEFTVHSEWINRPSTVIVDADGVVRLAYYGTYWGDRPTIKQTLEMIQTGRFDFIHPDRR